MANDMADLIEFHIRLNQFKFNFLVGFRKFET